MRSFGSGIGGSYRFDGLVSGAYTLVVTQVGHLPFEMAVTVETEDVQRDILLTPVDYTVRFVDEDGATLSEKIYHWGDAIVPPADPVKAEDNTYTYTFAGWDKAVSDCTGDATYAATYTAHRKPDVVTVITDGAQTGYTTLIEAMENAPANSTLKLLRDVDEALTVTKDLSVDLNGFDITGDIAVDGGKLLIMDSQTDDYTVMDEAGYGKLTGTVSGAQAADGYMMIAEETGVSFHRIDLTMTDMSLRPSQAGVYYKSGFAGDELVAQKVVRYGVALSVRGDPAEDAAAILSWFEGFKAGSNAANGTLLHGILKQTNSQAENAYNAQLPVYGRAYILTSDGAYIFGECVNRSLRQQVELIDGMWDELTETQQTGLVELYTQYQSVMESWNISNIKSNSAK